ncbi:hypothetical protein ACLG6S_10675 [Thermodesulfobacteriota bacterium B35]
MIRSARAKKRRRRRLYLAGLLVILLAAGGGILYRSPLSLQDIGRILELAAGRISGTSADDASAEPVLRGTIYDRLFQEMAVSYRLFTLTVHPAELADRTRAAEVLAGILGEDRKKLARQLKVPQRIVELADDLDTEQAAAIRGHHLAGVYCRSREERFYPAHTMAAHLLGFMGDGMGLAGVEGRYDIVLQPGEFRREDVPEIDFAGQQVLGRTTTDLVLTVDLALQKRIETRLREYLRSRMSRRGMALLLDPAGGRILAMASQPAFNPNYFWQADRESRRNRLFDDQLDLGLVRPLLLRAAAIRRDGHQGLDLLPPTVAASDYGISAEEVNGFARQVGLFRPVGLNLLARPGGTDKAAGTEDTVSGLQMAVAISALFNSGWSIDPWLLDSLYDHATGRRYHRRPDATRRELVLEPATGIRLRRALLLAGQGKKDGPRVFTATVNRVVTDGRFSRYLRQEAMIGLVPARSPKLLLLMVVELDGLEPLSRSQGKTGPTLAAMGRDLLPMLYGRLTAETEATVPAARSQENLRQFLISRRIDYREPAGSSAESISVMPDLVGLSLRKGLQRLGSRKVRLRIRGTGRIIAQQPAAGTPLHDVTDCVLTLESTIANSK